MSETRTLIGWLDRLAEHGDRTAVLAFGKEDRREWSHDELDRRSRRLARRFHQRELEAEDRVVLLGSPSPEWIAAALAVIRCGAIVVPLDVQLDDDTLSGVLEDSDPRLVLVSAEMDDRLDELGEEGLPERLRFETLFEHDESSATGEGEAGEGEATVEPEDPASAVAVLFYTSGTTGPPKGVPLSHRNLAFEIEYLVDSGLVTPEDRVLLPLPLHHVYPFVIGMLGPLAIGLPLILPHSLTGPQVTRALGEGDATVIIGVPRLYRALLSGIDGELAGRPRPVAAAVRALWRGCASIRRRWGVNPGRVLLRPLARRLAPSLRLLASGGSLLPPEVAARLQGLGWDVAIGYGLTETSPLVTVNPPGLERLDSVGAPIPEVEVEVDPEAEPARDSSSEERGEGRHGELLVRGPNVFHGYWKLPEKTEESLSEEGWFRTGDLATLEEDGHVRIRGRVSTVIVTEGGENVQPDQLEEAYAEHEAIREIGVLARDGGLAGLVVPETRELRETGAVDDGEGVEAAVRSAVDEVGRRLASYQRLSEVEITRDPLPRTRLGKIQRHKLEQRYEEARRGAEEREAKPIPIAEMSSDDRGLLDDPTAREVWQLLTEEFPERRLTPDSSPQLDLGIDSLKWLDLSLAINRRVGVELEDETIARIETVRDLLEEMASRSERGEVTSEEELFETPEEHLSDDQRRRIGDLRPTQRLLSRAGYRLNRWLVRGLFGLEVTRAGELPEPPFLVAPNHVSYLDAPAVAAALDPGALRRTFWAGWTGIMLSSPWLRLVSGLARVVPVDPERGARSSLAAAAAVLDRGYNLVWFPEGERSPEGELQDFKPGIGVLLEHRPVPVVPVWISGTREALPPGRRWPRWRHEVGVVLGAPLDPEELAESGAGDEKHERIAEALHEAMAGMGRASS